MTTAKDADSNHPANPQQVAKDKEAKAQDEQDRIRQDLHNAYAYIEGQRFTQATSAFTLEDMMDRFIDRLEGDGTQGRPGVIKRAKALHVTLAASVEQVKAMPLGAFKKPDPLTDANTPKDPA